MSSCTALSYKINRDLFNLLMERNKVFDFISGLFVVEVILLHANEIFFASEDWLVRYVMCGWLPFFMPWFYFKSGYFYKRRNDATFYKPLAKKLLIPFIFATVFAALIVLPFTMILYPQWNIMATPYHMLLGLWKFGSVPQNGPEWFLLSLFYVCSIVIAIDHFNIRWAYAILPIMGYLVTWIEPDYTYFAITTMFSGGTIYLCGIYMSSLNKESKRKKITLNILLIALYVATVLLKPSFLEMVTGQLQSRGNYILWILSSLGGICALIHIVPWLLRLRILNFFCIIGRRSMTYYLFHWPLLFVFKYSSMLIGFEYASYEGFLGSLTFLALTLPALDWLLRRYMPWA